MPTAGSGDQPDMVPNGREMAMHRPSIGTQVTGPESLRSPELHDFSDFPELIRANRSLVVVLAVAAILTIGHLAYRGHASPTDADVPRQTASARV